MTELIPRTLEYWQVHHKLRYHQGPASNYLCEGACNGQAREWANVHGTEEYVPLCVPCHKEYDRSTVCRKGHNIAIFGRTTAGSCRVCDRISTARRRKVEVCTACGYSPCRCIKISGPTGRRTMKPRRLGD